MTISIADDCHCTSSDEVYQPATLVYRPYPSAGISGSDRPKLKSEPLQIKNHIGDSDPIATMVLELNINVFDGKLSSEGWIATMSTDDSKWLS